MSTLRERVGEVLREYDKHQDMKDAEALDRILSIMASEFREAVELLRNIGERYESGEPISRATLMRIDALLRRWTDKEE